MASDNFPHPLLEEILCFLLVRPVCALPIGLAVPVVFHPPNSTPFLEVNAARASRSWHSILLFCGHSSVIAALETCMNTGESEAQRIWNAMRGPRAGGPKECWNNGRISAVDGRGEFFSARFKLSSCRVAFNLGLDALGRKLENLTIGPHQVKERNGLIASIIWNSTPF